jgi:hypothetical protein
MVPLDRWTFESLGDSLGESVGEARGVEEPGAA